MLYPLSYEGAGERIARRAAPPHAGAGVPPPQAATPSAARSRAAMSILFIVSMARIARVARACPGRVHRASSTPFGTTCQERPKRSFSQPHGPSWPPSERGSQ